MINLAGFLFTYGSCSLVLEEKVFVLVHLPLTSITSLENESVQALLFLCIHPLPSNYRKLEMIENLLCKKNVQDSTLLLSVSCL